MSAKMLKIDNEVFTVFCSQCKCCLAGSTHCGTCHTQKLIKSLCGCGDCVEKAQDYIQREQARIALMESRRVAREAIYG